ncbi:hypothetical protein GCM10009595_09230 [Falsarthrobacter nasiphocae]
MTECPARNIPGGALLCSADDDGAAGVAPRGPVVAGFYREASAAPMGRSAAMSAVTAKDTTAKSMAVTAP